MNSEYEEFRDAFEQFKRNLAYITGRNDELQEIEISKEIGITLVKAATDIIKDPEPNRVQQLNLRTGKTEIFEWMMYSGVIVKWKA